MGRHIAHAAVINATDHTAPFPDKLFSLSGTCSLIGGIVGREVKGPSFLLLSLVALPQFAVFSLH